MLKIVKGGENLISEKVCNLCKVNGISLAKLEKECGLSNATVRRWANSSPSAESLRKVADYFNVSVDYFLNRDIYSLSVSAQEYAKQFDRLTEEKKQLAMAYMSVVQAQ